jgi:diaminopropionate ammonia-lyase
MRVLLRLTTEPVFPAVSDRPFDFHRRLPGYRPSPLVEATRLAKKLGVAKVFVKDESSRFGLPSFKVLGASWATYAALRERLGPAPDGPLSYQTLQAWAARLRPLTLSAATDGNHGRAVARVARWFGLGARIFVPSFVSPARCRGIEAEGAELRVINGVYDASVDAAAEDAAHDADTLLISDTARSASDIIPQLVTAGYTTTFAEIEQQLSESENYRIDAISIQAGVGGLASAATSWATRRTSQSQPPRVIVVEPEPAACTMAALAAGEPVSVSASQISAMNVLQCGTVSLTAFPELQAGVSCCLAIEDSWATTAVSELYSCGIRSGPSGAAGIAGLLAAFGGPFAGPLREHLRLGWDARLLVVATEAAGASERPQQHHSVSASELSSPLDEVVG